MTLRILVNGAFGKMGQMVVKSITQESDLELVGQTGRKHNLAHEIQKTHTQIVIDFTHPDCVFENTNIIIKTGAHPVIGTTGLSSEQIQQLQIQCKKLKKGGIIAPNFSLGAVLMMKYAQQIAHYFPHIEIIEMHHDKKLDSPSGTAIRTAEMIASIRTDIPPFPASLRETIPHARGANHHHIPIHSIRLPGLVAHQQIIFGGLGETLTIKHDSIDRQSFMPGVFLACREVVKLDQLVYGLENIITS